VRYFPVHFAACAAACSAFLFTSASSQLSVSDSSASRPVIAVDGRPISAEEFESRLNLFSVGYPNDPVLRTQYVALGLIQEELLAESAREAHLDTLAQVRSVASEFEKEASYEEWMNREVRSKVTISDDEIQHALSLYKQQRVFSYRVYPDSVSARRAEPQFQRVLSGKEAPADTLTETKELEYGEAYKRVEDIAFAMKNGETRVIPVNGKWYLFGLKSVVPHPTRSKKDFSEAYADVLKIVHTEKERQLLGSKMSEVMAGHSFKLARQAREHLYRLLAQRIPFNNPQITKFPELVNQEIGSRLPPEADMKETFLTYGDGPKMTLGQLWHLISTGPYLLNYRSAAELRGGIDYLIRRVVIVETIAGAAYKQGLNRSPYVVRQKAMWTDNLLANMFLYRLSEHLTPTAQELEAEAAHKGTPAEIKDRALQRKTHAAIDSLLNRRIAHASISIDTTALYRTHVLEGDLVVRKEHFPNRFAVPRLTPANPEAAWVRKLMPTLGQQ
jgi:hypothetical protein